MAEWLEHNSLPNSLTAFNPSDGAATFFRPKHKDTKIFENRHVGVHWIALVEYSQMSYPRVRVSVFF